MNMDDNMVIGIRRILYATLGSCNVIMRGQDARELRESGENFALQVGYSL